LQQYIRFFWVLEDFTDAKKVSKFRILPDGNPAIVFQDSANFLTDDTNQKLPQLHVYGQFTKYTDLYVTGCFRTIGAFLEPLALKAIFKADANEFYNKYFSLDDVLPNNLAEQLINTSSLNEKINVFSNFLIQQIQSVNYENLVAKRATLLLQNNKSLIDIQTEMNISERTFERMIKQNVGMSPKIFSRITRFQTNLDLLRDNNFKKRPIFSSDSDYFDQSHYIREFKEFTGCNPRSFEQNVNEQLKNFLEWGNK